MLIAEGYFYHIRNDYFTIANDNTLMANHENGSYRPHFFAIRDHRNKDIFWMVPVSSKFIKFQKVYQNQVKKYGKCTKIVLGNCSGKKAAFLIQNAFPITSDFFDHIHTNRGKPLSLHKSTSRLIKKHLKKNLNLYKHGVNLFFADIAVLYKLMEEHLNSKDVSGQRNRKSYWELTEHDS